MATLLLLIIYINFIGVGVPDSLFGVACNISGVPGWHLQCQLHYHDRCGMYDHFKPIKRKADQPLWNRCCNRGQHIFNSSCTVWIFCIP